MKCFFQVGGRSPNPQASFRMSSASLAFAWLSFRLCHRRLRGLLHNVHDALVLT